MRQLRCVWGLFQIPAEVDGCGSAGHIDAAALPTGDARKKLRLSIIPILILAASMFQRKC
jgi:hypothetical protein